MTMRRRVIPAFLVIAAIALHAYFCDWVFSGMPADRALLGVSKARVLDTQLVGFTEVDGYRFGLRAGAGSTLHTSVTGGCIVPLIMILSAVGIAWTEPRMGHCAYCGYNLTANRSGRCPECGNKWC